MMSEASESDLNGGHSNGEPVAAVGGALPRPVQTPAAAVAQPAGTPQTESEIEECSDDDSSSAGVVCGGVKGNDGGGGGSNCGNGEQINNGYNNGGGDLGKATRGQQEQSGIASETAAASAGDRGGVQSPRSSMLVNQPIAPAGGGGVQPANRMTQVNQDDLSSSQSGPAQIKAIPIGDHKIRSKLRFEVVTAKVAECAGKKHVAYTIMMKRVGQEAHPAVIERRYSDFCFIYECILKSFHPSILGDFLFPKKVIIGNFKAEVISERTDAFHRFLNLIANCDNLLYSDYFYSFLSSEEHNEAVSHIKLGRYAEATPLLQTIFYVREKLLSVANIHVLLVACELVACLSASSGTSAGTAAGSDRKRKEEALAFADVAMKSFELVGQSRNAEEIMVAEPLRIPFLRLGLELATELGAAQSHRKVYERQLSELRYAGVRLENSPPLLEVIRDRYIHRASHTSKIS